MNKPFKKVVKDISVEEAHGGSGKRQMLFTKDDKVSPNIDGATKGFLAPDACFDWHNHGNIDEFFIVLQGVGRVDFEDGSVIEYSEGDLVYMPSPQKHKITNTGKIENLFYFFRIKN